MSDINQCCHSERGYAESRNLRISFSTNGKLVRRSLDYARDDNTFLIFKLQFMEQGNVRQLRTNDLESCKIILHIHRKNDKLFVIFSEKVLDILLKGCYYYLARVGGICGFSRK